MTSHKDDLELGALKAGFDAATPAPDPARRLENLALAQKNFTDLQGSLSEARHSSERSESRGVFKGVIDMLMTRSAAAGLTATTAIVAVGFLFLSPAGQDFMRPPTTITTQPEIEQPVSGDLRQGGETAIVDADDTEVVEPVLEPVITAEEVETRLRDQEAEADFAAAPPSPSPQPGNSGGVLELFSGAPVASPAITQGGHNNSVVGGLASNTRAVSPGQLLNDVAPMPEANTEEFANEDDNPIRVVAENPVSTFSIDVDTASYSLLRSSFNRGQMPHADSVRIEEMINYFPYDYATPTEEDVSPFRPTVNVFQTPWNPDTRLVHIGLQGEMPVVEDRPPLNLVFLIDTSGSMNDPTKLPLLIQSFRLMLDRLNPEDEVAIVTYAGNAGVALEPTPASDRDAIETALTRLQAGGSTNGVGGLQVAYGLANQMSEEGEVSRVLLATDGDFNVGISDPDALTDFIETQRDSGTYLSVLGFGRGNLQDDTMQALAQNGNGTAAYIDTLNEAQRVLVDQLAGALFPIADDVKIQVEFNPAVIAEYRLIGYETRALAREDFNNDDVDAGELGAGHNVTAIYEVTPVGSPARLTDPLRYGGEEATEVAEELAGELGFLRLRWKEPGAEDSQLIEFPITDTDSADAEAQFAAAIAGFGQLLRGNDFLGDWDYADAIALANENRGADEFGYRFEAVQLMRLADSLSAN